MSETVIYGVKSNGTVEFVGETKNAWRGGMHVWMKLSEAYGIQGGFLGGFKELWKMADTGVLKEFENITLKSTFDNVVVKREDIPKLIAAFKEFEENYPNSSLWEQARIIEDDIINDEDMIGVCWNQTSVNSNPWMEDYDEEKDEEVPYNILSGNRHWFL